MNLTPLDVRRKEFDKAFRGYDPTEVDLFLKQVADRLEDVQEEFRRTEEKTREAEAKLVHYEKVELALQEALESARESARRSEASAEEKARLIVQQAELRAEKIVHDAERERYGLRQEVSKLGARQAEIAARLRGFLFSELEVLAQFQGDDPVGFIKLQPAGGTGPQSSLPPAPARLEAPISDMEDAPDEWSRSEAEAEAPGWSDAPEPEPRAPLTPRPAPPASGDEPGGAREPAAERTVEPVRSEPTAPLEPPVSAPPPSAPPPSAPPPSAPPPSAPPPSAPPPSAPPPSAESPLTGAYASAEEASRPAPPPPTDPPPTAPEPPRDAAPLETGPPAVTGGWDLRSLVTGEERSVTASDQEREAIKRILDDLD